jgi:Fe-S cluster biogenesis protein NfuA
MCAQCALANITMRDLVEAKIREFVSPEIYVEEQKDLAD